MPPAPRFSSPVLAKLEHAKILGVRAGLGTHRFLGVWMVVVERRLFVRSWNDKPTGWYRAFLAEPRGTIQVEDRQLPVRARAVRSERVLDAVEAAYAEKYDTPGARKWVRGFRAPKRRAATLELVPR